MHITPVTLFTGNTRGVSMAKKTLPRKALFRAAVALNGESVEDVARRYNVTRGHLYAVLSDERESKKLSDAIDEYIDGARSLMGSTSGRAA